MEPINGGMHDETIFCIFSNGIDGGAMGLRKEAGAGREGFAQRDDANASRRGDEGPNGGDRAGRCRESVGNVVHKRQERGNGGGRHGDSDKGGRGYGNGHCERQRERKGRMQGDGDGSKRSSHRRIA